MRRMVLLGLVSLLVAGVAVGCGGTTPTSETQPITPDDSHTWPFPPATELCRVETNWPEDTRFVTPKYVMRRFTELTGYALETEKSLGIPQARTLIHAKGQMPLFPPNVRIRGEGVYDAYGQFVLNVIDSRCPALIEWLLTSREGDEIGSPGAGGLIWEYTDCYGGDELGGCWSGSKRYPHSNLVVHWDWYSTPRVDRRWSRLNAVLGQIAARR